MPPTPHADSALSGIPDGSQIDAFADALWLEEGLARNTLDAYRRDLIALVRWLAPHCKGLLQVQETDLQAYFAYRHAQTRATTANRRLTVFKRFFGWALRERLVAQDPTLRLQAARQPLRVPKTLSQAQVEALLAAPDVGTPLGLRDRAMLELMYASGLRVSELVALKTWHLGMNEGVLRVLGKGSKERLVPFGEVARQWLERYLQEARVGHPGRAADRRPVCDCPWRRHDPRDVLDAGKKVRGHWRALPRRCHPIRCAMRLPPICSTMGPICAWCSCCWGMRIFPPPPSIPMWRVSACASCTRSTTHAGECAVITRLPGCRPRPALPGGPC
jgi:integrase